MNTVIKRLQVREIPQFIPQPIPDEPGLVQVHVTWGTIQPMQIDDSVCTIGEVEVIKHLEQGLPIVDSRTSDMYDESTIPGAINIPFPETATRLGEFDLDQPTIFFCNGPQCGQSPTAVRTLLEAGYPPGKIFYYRGGLHD